VVECDLAKVDVEGSSPFSRSTIEGDDLADIAFFACLGIAKPAAATVPSRSEGVLARFALSNDCELATFATHGALELLGQLSIHRAT
jgi:hypothetical protein